MKRGRARGGCAWALGAVLSLVVPGARAAPGSDGLPLAVNTFKIPGGLTLVVVPRPGSGLVAYDTLVRAGSRDEVDPGRTGFAHFFEHMMFRGTPLWPRERYEKVLREHGGRDNAFTRADVTVYHVVARATALPQLVEMEADRFQNLWFGAAQLRTEAQAVLGEFNKSRMDPDQAAYEALLATAYTAHTYGHTTLGREADIRAMPTGLTYARAFFKRHYTPDNCVVLVVGDVDPDDVRARVAGAYGPWKGSAAMARVPREPLQTAERRTTVAWSRPAQPRLLMAWHVPAAGARNATALAAADVLRSLLFGPTSALYDRLVRKDRLVEDVGAWSSHRRDPTLLVVEATLTAPQHAAAVEAAVQQTLAQLAGQGLDAERLDAVKSRRRYGLLGGLERVEQTAETLAGWMGPTGSLQWLSDYLEALKALSVQDVQAFARTYLQPQGVSVVFLNGTAAPQADEP